MNNKEMERIKNITRVVNKIITERLFLLSYFDSNNFNINVKTLQKNLITDAKDILGENQFALYIARLNTIFLDIDLLSSNIADEFIEILILHEYIHMCSTNLQKQIVGYANPVLPLTFNEGCTQWITLMLYYGKENMEKVLNTNIYYSESTKIINEMVKKLGEEKVFYRFFSADVKGTMDNLTAEEKSLFIDFILRLSNTMDEKKSLEGISQLKENISQTLKS